MNRALCDSCRELVPASPEERDGKVFLTKECPSCGRTETLISGDAGRYMAKRELDSGFDYQVCLLDCLECQHRKRPTFVFVDITNRCNLNCPICINNTPSMGFVFEPPMEYFERIFASLAEYDPPPAVQLFGGEPTMRDDLFDIIGLARSYGLPTRVVTNGLKLADEEYCKRICDARVHVLLAFDGLSPEIYERMRKNPGAYEKKIKALENLKKYSAHRNTIMCCVPC